MPLLQSGEASATRVIVALLYTYPICADSESQSDGESWRMQIESIQRFSIPMCRQMTIASWKVGGKSANGIPSCRWTRFEVVVMNGTPEPQQWLRAAHLPGLPSATSKRGSAVLPFGPICRTLVGSALARSVQSSWCFIQLLSHLDTRSKHPWDRESDSRSLYLRRSDRGSSVNYQ